MAQRTIMLFDVKFVFEVVGTRHRCRKPRSFVFSDVAPVEVLQVDRTDVRAAYSFKPARGPAFDIVMHDGRLYWPALKDLGGHPGTVEARLRRLLSWKLDALVRERRDEPSAYPDLGWRHIVHNGYQPARALLNRRAQSCLVVGEELFALGGSPLIPRRARGANYKYPLLSAGTSRALDPVAVGLGWQPGNLHLIDSQPYLATGLFEIPSPSKSVGGLTAYVDLPVEANEVRLDATFRIAWDALQWRRRNSRHPAAVDVAEQFAAAEVGPVAQLSERRCEVLSYLRYRRDELRLGAPLNHLVGATLTALGRSESDSKPELTEEDVAALLSLME